MQVTILIQSVEYRDGLVICPLAQQPQASITGNYANVKELDAAVDRAISGRQGCFNAQVSLHSYDHKMRGFDAYKHGAFQGKRYLHRSPVWEGVA